MQDKATTTRHSIYTCIYTASDCIQYNSVEDYTVHINSKICIVHFILLLINSDQIYRTTFGCHKQSPGLFLATKSSPSLLKVVLQRTIFLSQKWSYVFGYNVTGKECRQLQIMSWMPFLHACSEDSLHGKLWQYLPLLIIYYNGGARARARALSREGRTDFGSHPRTAFFPRPNFSLQCHAKIGPNQKWSYSGPMHLATMSRGKNVASFKL